MGSATRAAVAAVVEAVARRADPEGDRVVITLDGKFLSYQW